MLVHESPLVPINLDTVMRLAEDQNRQIALAREKLNASEMERQLAASSWLPNVYAGVGYYRHEGPYQNEDGTITRSSFGSLFPGVTINTEYDVKEATFRRVDATRKMWQQKARGNQGHQRNAARCGDDLHRPVGGAARRDGRRRDRQISGRTARHAPRS